MKNNGEIEAENGKREIVDIQYVCVGCEEKLSSKKVLELIVDESSKEIKKDLKYPLSFIPLSLDITIKNEDSLYYHSNNKKIENVLLVEVKYEYSAKNEYGNDVSGNNMVSLYIQNDSFLNVYNIMKLDKLEIDENGEINRHLILFGNKSEYISLSGFMKNKYFFIMSSMNCENSEIKLHILFKNGKEIIKNCESDGECENYIISKINENDSTESHLLKNVPIKKITLKRGNEIVDCLVPDNNSDYIIQLLKL